MIWTILIILVVAILLYICAPLFGGGISRANADASLSEYRDKLTEIDKQIDEAGEDSAQLIAAKTALQRKILEHVSEASSIPLFSAKSISVPIIAVFSVSAILLYNQLGTPELTEKPVESAQGLEDLPLDQLIVRLEATLEADPANPNGWILYARSLMALGKFDDALAAYDRVLALTNSDEKIIAERESAVRYMDQVQKSMVPAAGPSAEDIKAAAEMSAEQRDAMVQNMVDGLSAKLIENSNDEAGWIRLLKARQVLGQTEMAEQEANRMRDVFKDQPEIIERILNASGQDTP
jgi:cytochrome c-type biogenesis protein CcmI